MKKIIVLYNSASDNSKGFENAQNVTKVVKDAELEFVDLLTIEDLKSYFGGHDKDQEFIISGGDGTLNHFINAIEEKDIPTKLFYFPSGTGNDFYKDVSERENTDGIVELNKYLVNLPTTKINGKTYRFLNNVGYGIDGYCCEVADKKKTKSDKPINYAGIAIKGLLFFFKSKNATITVDGVTKTYKHVWLAPVMHGKYYGGGMIPCPQQDRNDKELSMLVWHCGSKLATLINFPNIFKGAHLKNKKRTEVIKGSKFVIEFDKPCAAQIDGETVLNVTKVEVDA